MNVQNLVKMANQIGQFFESEPDHQQAVSYVKNGPVKRTKLEVQEVSHCKRRL